MCQGEEGEGGGIEKILLTDRTVPTIFKQIQRKCFFDREIEFVSIRSVKLFFPTSMILKKVSGDEHKFCTTLMEKTVGGIGILNSDLFSDQFFSQCSGSVSRVKCVVYSISREKYVVQYRVRSVANGNVSRRKYMWFNT